MAESIDLRVKRWTLRWYPSRSRLAIDVNQRLTQGTYVN
jgi:hypothetical protein